MHVRQARIALLATTLAGGCDPVRLGGVIDGEGVGGARDAVWDTFSAEFGPFEYEVTAILITDFPEACDTYGQFLEVSRTEVGCDEVCEEYVDLASEKRLTAPAYWSTVLVVNTSDGRDGVFDHDPDVGEGEFQATFNDYDAEPLQGIDLCEDACEDGELLIPEAEAAEDGELELEADGDLLVGRFSAAFGGEDGLDGRFVAEPCDMEDWVWPF